MNASPRSLFAHKRCCWLNFVKSTIILNDHNIVCLSAISFTKKKKGGGAIAAEVQSTTIILIHGSHMNLCQSNVYRFFKFRSLFKIASNAAVAHLRKKKFCNPSLGPKSHGVESLAVSKFYKIFKGLRSSPPPSQRAFWHSHDPA